MGGGGRLERRAPAGLTPAQGRRFGLSVGMAFLGLGGVLVWRARLTEAYAPFSLGGALILAGLLIPGRLGPVERAWMGVASAISKVTTPVFMAVVYFLLLTPTGVLMRVLGRNPLAKSVEGESLWVERSRTESDLKRQF